MARDYAEDCLRTILQDCGGNVAKARNQVFELVGEDHRFLLGLVEPYLAGIVAHGLIRAGQPKEPARPPEPKAIDLPPDDFARALYLALAGGNTPMFGKEGAAPPLRRTGASHRHEDTLRKIARAPSFPVAPPEGKTGR